MYIKQIRIFILKNLRDSHFRSVFAYRIYFLEYSLWKYVRKIRFETDGTFDSIFIALGSDSVCSKIRDNSVNKMLEVFLPFDFERYEQGDDEQRCLYFIELLRQGLQIASEIKNIPYQELMEFANELADNGFVYTWPFKNVTLRDYGLKVKFVSELSSRDYVLKLQAFEKKNPSPICEGQVARIKPDSIFFSNLSKRIVVEDGNILINNRWEETLLTININSLLNGTLDIDYPKSPFCDDPQKSEWFYRQQANLRYDNYNFE